MIRFPLKLRFINRSAPQSLVNASHYSKDSSTSSSSSDDEGKVKKAKPQKSKEALLKLNHLLKQMAEENVERSKTTLNLAKPKPRRDVRTEQGTQVLQKETVEKKIVLAVKEVASTFAGNVKQTESELLSKLLNTTKEGEVKDAKEQLNLSDIIKDMKIDREKKGPAPTRGEQVKQMLQNVREKGGQDPRSGRGKSYRMPAGRQEVAKHEKIDLFGSKPLGIFTAQESPKAEPSKVENKTWDMLYQRDLRLAITHPPSNHFQQMILWTEEEKIWKFPIDNEQGLQGEKNVYFADHVFLEKHLEEWCPNKGPIRHFMELVCVGLSKNPYLSVQEKREHIDWYKKYFEDKKKLLKEIGAIPTEDTKGQTKNI